MSLKYDNLVHLSITVSSNLPELSIFYLSLFLPLQQMLQLAKPRCLCKAVMDLGGGYGCRTLKFVAISAVSCGAYYRGVKQAEPE